MRRLPLLLAGSTLLLGLSAPAQNADQQRVLDATNAARAGQGIAPLRWDANLATAAVQHARAMQTAATLSHQLPGEPDAASRAAAAGARFSAVAENIAFGYSPDAIMREWMHSTPHRTNILDPRMNAIGIALVPGGGTIWAVEDFADTEAALTPQQVEQDVVATLRGKGLAIAAPGSAEHAAASAACPQFEGGAGGHARFVVRWESSDLHALPGPLADAAASRQYTLAAVAACAPVNTRNRDFAAYRVAVLLF